MIRTIVIIVLLLSSFTACDRHRNTYALDDRDLVNILCDLHVLEFMLKRKDKLPQDSIKQLFYADMEAVYKLPIEEIFENLEKLRNDPVKYNGIYIEVARVLEEEMVNTRKESVSSELKDIKLSE